MTLKSPPAEERVILRGISWEKYLQILGNLDDHGGRIAYDDGLLEIMSPNEEHENTKRLIGRLIEALTEELDMVMKSGGSTTYKRELRKKGIEPDESYYLGEESVASSKTGGGPDLEYPSPDLAVEVEITRSQLNKLSIYSALGVREVWRYRRNALRIYQLRSDGQYLEVKRSAVLPMLSAADVLRFISMRGSLGETRIVRAFRAWVRERLERPA